MSLSVDRVERFEDGEILNIAINAQAEWARSEFPHPMLIADYDKDGNLIGLEAVGELARRGLDAMFNVVLEPADELRQLVLA
jgi:hypothetical protein